MKQFIITATTNHISRKDLEDIEGNVYESLLDFTQKVNFHDKVYLIPMSEFMDMVNDQELDNLTDSWIGYIFIEKI
jgi:hypothetical protein